MSQFPSAPPAGAYTPPNQTPQPQGLDHHQQQQQQQPHYGYQQPHVPSPYGAPASGYNASASHKPTKAFGQAFNQAVTQGKPMLDKLGKTISSRLGNKQSKQSTPQHLESYQHYQNHHQQGQPLAQQYQQAQPQSYQNQGQQFNPGSQSVYQTPQQSPFVQSTYGTPSSGNSGQNNYFPQQTSQPPNQHAPQYPQVPQQQLSNPSLNNTNTAEQTHSYGGQPPGHPTHGHFNQGQPEGLPQHTPLGHAPGQQTGVVGGPQPQSHTGIQQCPPAHPPPEKQQLQQQWAAAAPGSHGQDSPVPQSPAQFNPTPPPQQYNVAPPVPIHPNQQQPQQTPQTQHQQWAPMSPVSPQVQQVQQVQHPASGSSPPPQPCENPQAPAPVASSQHQQQPSQSHPPQQPPTPVSQTAPLKPTRTEFIAELPADLGNMTIVEGSKLEQTPSNPTQGASYQAYRHTSGQNTSPGPGYTIPRRAVSTSSLPMADPWSLADAVTELPTREFYVIADLVFDSIDRRFEPRNTGLLEASKVLDSWRAQEVPEQAAQLFAHDSYGAFAKLWSLEGVPHMMVPCQPSLMPTWNFQQQIHSQEVKLQEEATSANAAYPTYMPALNRAGWYKYFFLNLLHHPEELEKTLSDFCADTYKPSILNQPDVQKRDRNDSPALLSRATAISSEAVSRVCQEVVTQMQGTSPRDASQGAAQAQPSGRMTDQEVVVKLHSLQMQRQFNNMMNHTMTQGGINFSSATGNTYGGPNFGSLV